MTLKEYFLRESVTVKCRVIDFFKAASGKIKRLLKPFKKIEINTLDACFEEKK